MGADGDVQAVIFLLQVLDPDVLAHGDAGMHLDAQRQDGLDLRIQQMPGETVVGDAVAEHTAQLLGLLIHGDLVAHKGQVVGAAEAAGAAAHNGDLLAGGRGALRLGHLPCVVYGVALEAPDVDGVVDHVPAAPSLAGMLTDVGAGGGEGVVLADQPHRVGAVALAHQGHVAGNVHSCRAQSHAGHRVFQPCQAPMVQDVLLVVVPEALQAVHHQPGSVPSDGAVGGVYDGARRLFNGNQGAHGGGAGKHLLQEQGKLAQANAAGHALAAALGMAQAQEAQRHIHRAQARGAGGNASLHITVKIFYHSFSPAGRLDIQSAHTESSPSCILFLVFSVPKE